MLKRLAVAMLIISDLACAPKNANYPVADMRGNLADGLRPDTWNYGQVKHCELASRNSHPPDARGNVLFCGLDTSLAWNVGLLRPDLKSQIYENTKVFPITFRSSGHSSKTDETWWWCQRIPEGIRCD